MFLKLNQRVVGSSPQHLPTCMVRMDCVRFGFYDITIGELFNVNTLRKL